MKNKKTKLLITIDEQDKKSLQKLAESDMRSLTSYVHTVLRQHIRTEQLLTDRLNYQEDISSKKKRRKK